MTDTITPEVGKTYLTHADRKALLDGLSDSEGVATSGRSGGDAPCQNEGIEVLEIGGKLRYVDASIAPLVKVLNDAGFLTVASCSGHGERPGNIALADGREMIIAQGYREARTIDRMFPGINGEQSLHDRAYRYADEFRAYLEAGGKLTGPAVESLIEFIMNMTGHGADDTPPAQDTQRAERATQDKAD